jgi:hypothetical protein
MELLSNFEFTQKPQHTRHASNMRDKSDDTHVSLIFASQDNNLQAHSWNSSFSTIPRKGKHDYQEAGLAKRKSHLFRCGLTLQEWGTPWMDP